MRYAFGDSDLAARRLQLLGEVFAPSTRAFLQASVSREPSLVVDLGCGPGYTTHFLAETLPCGRAVGLDHSDHFISLAQQTATQRVSFQAHDVTQVPFPTGPADLLYCRFLLTHLRDPEAVVARWTDQLRPGGLLLMEEAESRRTPCTWARRWTGSYLPAGQESDRARSAARGPRRAPQPRCSA